MAILFLTSVVRSEVAIHIHSLDKREFRSSLQKGKQVSDNQRKLCYNRIILMELRKEKKKQLKKLKNNKTMHSYIIHAQTHTQKLKDSMTHLT